MRPLLPEPVAEALLAVTVGAAVGVVIAKAARYAGSTATATATHTATPTATAAGAGAEQTPRTTPPAGPAEQVKGFWSDVRAGMQEREGQLRLALGLDAAPPDTRLDPQATRDLLEDPARWRAPKG
jgi:hypothetical protein